MSVQPLPLELGKTAERFPNAVAIKHAEESIDFRNLNYKIDVLANFVGGKISPGDRVGVLLDNSIPYVIACYAIWRAGGVVVGLNTALQAEELARLLKHCEAKMLVLGKPRPDLLSLWSKEDAPYILRLFENAIDYRSEYWGRVFATGSQLEKGADLDYCASTAMIIYTSGTTGNPKGVVLSHRNLAENIQSICQYLELNNSDVAMCVLPFFYSFGNSVLHSHLLSGSCLVLENSFMYPHKVLEKMVSEKVSAFYGVPSTYYLLLARTQLGDYDFSQLRFCAQAGGHMDPQRVKRFREHIPSSNFVVMYGQTEAAARISWLPPEKLKQKSGSVGLAIPGVEIVVKSESGELCTEGQEGEVCVRGPNVMCGYFKDEAQTAGVLKQGYLHTGDLGYKDADGYLFLVGRNSEMIKTGAHRVSPKEIEEVVNDVAGVAEAAVVGKEDEVLGSVIACCIVREEAAAEENILKREIMRSCKQKLPAYKMPKEIRFYETLPKTASGKIKKHLLIKD